MLVFVCVVFTVINVCGFAQFIGLNIEIITSICLILSPGKNYCTYCIFYCKLLQVIASYCNVLQFIALIPFLLQFTALMAFLLQFIGLNIEIITSICLILSPGLALDYAAHIGVMYACLKDGSRKQKMRITLGLVDLNSYI